RSSPCSSRSSCSARACTRSRSPAVSSSSRGSRTSGCGGEGPLMAPSLRHRHNRLMAEDFMPLLGWDHVELWVGNAKQAAYFYEHAMGFSRTAYCGPETGVRDRASYVLEQGDVRLVVTSAVREESDITKHHAKHG